MNPVLTARSDSPRGASAQRRQLTSRVANILLELEVRDRTREQLGFSRQEVQETVYLRESFCIRDGEDAYLSRMRSLKRGGLHPSLYVLHALYSMRKQSKISLTSGGTQLKKEIFGIVCKQKNTPSMDSGMSGNLNKIGGITLMLYRLTRGQI